MNAQRSSTPHQSPSTHIGSLGIRADLTDLYVRLSIECKTPVLMICNPIPQMAEHYPRLAEHGEVLIKELESARLPVVDYLAPSVDGRTCEELRDSCIRILRNLKPGFTQFIIHCGIANEELRGITASAAHRDYEHRMFMDPKVIAQVEKLGIELITCKQLRELQQQ